jgi:hypothetical protein
MKEKLIIVALFVFSLLLSPSQVKAQGTFDCNWTDAAGRNACRATNFNCESGYEVNQRLCTQLTDDGKVACEAQKNLPCVTEAELDEYRATVDVSEITCEGGGIDTAIGCIPFEDTNSLVGFFLKWAIGIGGGISFLLIVFAGFQIATSSGNPERLKAGQELMTSAIAGLIMLIFSVFILRIIGIDILGLGQFGFGAN